MHVLYILDIPAGKQYKTSFCSSKDCLKTLSHIFYWPVRGSNASGMVVQHIYTYIRDAQGLSE